MEIIEQLASVTEALEKTENRIVKAEKKAAKYDELRENTVSGGLKPVGNSANSDEQKALRYFGAPNVQKLLEVNVAHPNFNHVPEELKHLVISLKSDLDVSRMVSQIFRGDALDKVVKGDNDLIAGNVKGVMDSYFAKSVLAPKIKAFGTGTAGEGLEWVPTAVASNYIEEHELSRQVASMFRSVNMPTKTYNLPTQDSTTIARRQAEKATIPSENFTTGEISFTAEKLTQFVCLPEELNEDSAPDILAANRREVVESQGRAIETGIINGDTAGTHQDSDVTGVVDARTAWDGLRKLALSNSATVDFLNAASTTAKFRSVRSAMDKFGVEPRQLAWFVSSKIYFQMLGLDEVTTVEKYGPMATILKGALAALDGIPIIISEFARDDLNASGVYDGITTDRSSVILANTSRFMLGVRRPIRVRAVPNPTPPNDEWLLASWWRGDFQGHAQDAGESSVVYGINIA